MHDEQLFVLQHRHQVGVLRRVEVREEQRLGAGEHALVVEARVVGRDAEQLEAEAVGHRSDQHDLAPVAAASCSSAAVPAWLARTPPQATMRGPLRGLGAFDARLGGVELVAQFVGVSGPVGQLRQLSEQRSLTTGREEQ